MHDQHVLADRGGEGAIALQGAGGAVEHDVRGDEGAHRGEVVARRGERAVVANEPTLLVARQIEILLADVVGAVVPDGIAGRVFQALARQHHDGAVHAVGDVPGHHAAARRTVVDEHARLRCPEAQHGVLSGRHSRQVAAAERADRGVEVDVVQHGVTGRIDQRELHVVALVHHDDGTGDRAVERERPHEGAGRHLYFLFLHDHAHGNHAGRAGANLLVSREARGRDRFLRDPFQTADVHRFPGFGAAPIERRGSGDRFGIRTGVGGDNADRGSAKEYDDKRLQTRATPFSMRHSFPP